MKSRVILLALAYSILVPAGLFTTACTVVDRVRSQLSEFHAAATAAGDEAVVYAAAQRSLEGMGYTHQRGSLASHRLEMATPVQPGGNAQNLRQRRAILAFRAIGSEGTEVKIGFWETSEETAQKDNAVVGSRLIQGGALYEAFWDRLNDALPDEDPAGAPAPSTPASGSANP